MATPRTTAKLIRGINPDIPSTLNLSIYILTANNLVNNVCVGSAPRTYDNETLTLIETWLAAHFHSMYAPRAIEEEADDVRDKWDTSLASPGFTETEFGRMALMLDTNGVLANLNYVNTHLGQVNPSFVWLGGKNPDDPNYGISGIDN